MDLNKIKQLIKDTNLDDDNEVKFLIQDIIDDEVSFWKGEAEKAFKKRDEAKAKLRDLERKFEQLDSFYTKKLDSITQAKPKKILNDKELELQVVEQAKKNDAINPQHVFKLTRDDFTKNEAGEYVVINNDKEISLSDYVKDFLSQNDHLVSAKTNIFGIPIQRTARGIGEPVRSNKNEISQDDELEADEHGLDVHDWVQIKRMKERKLRQHA